MTIEVAPTEAEARGSDDPPRDAVSAFLFRSYDATLPPKALRRAGNRFMGYRRNSVDESTIDSQQRQAVNINEYAQRQGLIRVHEDAVDAGCSGVTVHGRTGFAAVMVKAKRREMDVVVVEAVDRWARNVADAIRTFKRLESYGVELHATKYGKLSETQVLLMAYMASEGRDRSVALMSDGRREKAKKGLSMAAATYGYRKHPTQPGVRIIVPERQSVILRIFDEALHAGDKTIAAGLTRDGIPPPRYCAALDRGEAVPSKVPAWKPTEVHHIIRNPQLMGTLVWGKTQTVRDPDTHEIIRRERPHLKDVVITTVPDHVVVPPSTWIEVNQAKDARGFGRDAQGKRAGVHLLTPVISCAACGSRMHVVGAAANKVYVCSGSRSAEEDSCRVVRTVRADWVEEAVLREVKVALSSAEADERFRHGHEAACTRLNAARSRERRQVRNEIGELEQLLQRSFMQTLVAGFSTTTIEENRRSIEGRLAQFRARAAKLELQADARAGFERMQTLSDALEGLIARAPTVVGDSATARVAQLLRKLVPSVLVQPPDDLDRRPLHITIDRMALLEDDPELEASTPPHAVECLIDTKAKKRAELEAKISASDALVATAAASGIYDLPDEVWDVVRPAIADLRLAPGVLPRTVVNAMLCLAKSGGSLARSPEHYGDPKLVMRAVKRIIYTGAWDAVVALLRAEHPHTLEGAALHRFESTSWKRKAVPTAPIDAGNMDRPALERLMTASMDERERVRVQVCLSYLDGHSRQATSDVTGLSTKHVSTITASFRRYGIHGIRAKIQPRIHQNRRKLTQSQRDEVCAIARSGLDPDRPGKGVRVVDLIRLCGDRYGIEYTMTGMIYMLRREGIDLRQATRAALVRQRGDQSGPDRDAA